VGYITNTSGGRREPYRTNKWNAQRRVFEGRTKRWRSQSACRGVDDRARGNICALSAVEHRDHKSQRASERAHAVAVGAEGTSHDRPRG
jgi:hypothetical protein